MQKIKPIIRVIKNKYFIATIGFIIWMLFFDPKDWALMRARTNKLKELKQSEKIISAQIRDTRKELSLLKSDAGSIEKYAREKFLMKKDNEDLFIVRTP